MEQNEPVRSVRHYSVLLSWVVRLLIVVFLYIDFTVTCIDYICSTPLVAFVTTFDLCTVHSVRPSYTPTTQTSFVCLKLCWPVLSPKDPIRPFHTKFEETHGAPYLVLGFHPNCPLSFTLKSSCIFLRWTVLIGSHLIWQQLPLVKY